MSRSPAARSGDLDGEHSARVVELAHGEVVLGEGRRDPRTRRAAPWGAPRASARARARSPSSAPSAGPGSSSRGAGGSRRTDRGRRPCRSGTSGSAASSSRLPATTPAVTSWWPFRYFVPASQTRSAPSSSGRQSDGRGERVVHDEEPVALERGVGRDVGDREARGSRSSRCSGPWPAAPRRRGRSRPRRRPRSRAASGGARRPSRSSRRAGSRRAACRPVRASS